MTTIGLTRHAPGARLTPADQATLDAMADRGINATALRLGVGRGVVERLRHGGHAPARTVARVAAGIAIAAGMWQGEI